MNRLHILQPSPYLLLFQPHVSACAKSFASRILRWEFCVGQFRIENFASWILSQEFCVKNFASRVSTALTSSTASSASTVSKVSTVLKASTAYCASRAYSELWMCSASQIPFQTSQPHSYPFSTCVIDLNYVNNKPLNYRHSTASLSFHCSFSSQVNVNRTLQDYKSWELWTDTALIIRRLKSKC